jgi:hypothetical protein
LLNNLNINPSKSIMNYSSYNTLIPNPPKFTNYSVKSCPTHGYKNTVTSNDGNKTQKCMLCNWSYQHIENTQKKDY